jgi:hypothetical protein
MWRCVKTDPPPEGADVFGAWVPTDLGEQVLYDHALYVGGSKHGSWYNKNSNNYCIPPTLWTDIPELPKEIRLKIKVWSDEEMGC